MNGSDVMTCHHTALTQKHFDTESLSMYVSPFKTQQRPAAGWVSKACNVQRWQKLVEAAEAFLPNNKRGLLAEGDNSASGCLN